MPIKDQASSKDKASIRQVAQPIIQQEAAATVSREGTRAGVFSPSNMLAMQRTMGNQAVRRVISSHIQRFDEKHPAYQAFLINKGEQDSRENRLMYLEIRDSGHSLENHGPLVSNAKLKERLVKGNKGRDGTYSSVNASAKFKDYDVQYETRVIAVKLVQEAYHRTLALLGKYLDTEALDGSVWRGINYGEVREKFRSVGNNVQINGLLPVEYISEHGGNPPKFHFFSTYIIIKKYSESIGSGYVGIPNAIPERQSKHPEHGFDIYTDLYQKEVPKIEYSSTSFNILPNTPLQADLNVNNWMVGQHFPRVNGPERISGAGTVHIVPHPGLRS